MENFQNFLLQVPVLLFSMVAHEYAHGYAALKQGDTTAYQLGRLTWNPVKHIDPFMTILLPILTWFGSGGSFIFGGAKPVPVNPQNYRSYTRGDIIVSLAGVATNMVIAVLCTGLVVLLGLLGRGVSSAASTLGLLQRMMVSGILFNLVLAIFNLLPIPPLDGSHVMRYLLPPTWRLRYDQLGRFGILIVMLIVATRVGRPIFEAWMKPVELLFSAAIKVVFPFMLQSPFGLGV